MKFSAIVFKIPVFILSVSLLSGCSHNTHVSNTNKQQQENTKQNEISQIESAKTQITGAKDITKEIINSFIAIHPNYDQFTDYKTQEKNSEDFYKDKGIFRTVFSGKQLEYDNIFKEWNLFSNNIGGETKLTGENLGVTVMNVKFKYKTFIGESWSVRLKKYRIKMTPEEARKVETIEAFGRIIDAKKEPYYREATLSNPTRMASETHTVIIDPILLKINMKDNSSLFTLVKTDY